MTDVFLTVLRMSATGGLVILAVLLVRLCLKKAPKRWRWALWAVVLFRLLTPFGIPVSVALPAGLPAGLPDFSRRAETVPAATEESSLTDFSVSSSVESDNEAPAVPLDPDLLVTAPGEPVSPGGINTAASSAPSAEPSGGSGKNIFDYVAFARVLAVAPFVWLAGAALMAGWNLAAYRLLKNRLAEAVPTGTEGVYEVGRVDSAFVVGLVRPKIYLPAGLSMVEQACVVAHERAHIRRGDPWWRLLSFAALTVHWFNPLVWLAFRLSGKDMEMSCDEAVLRRTPVDIRAAYSRTLVKFASRGRIEGPALAFGEGETGSRVKNVMKYKKPVLWVSVAAAVVLVLTGVVLAVNIRAKDTSLPYSRYQVEEVLFYGDERTPDIVKQMRYEIAGDGSFWVNFSNSDTIGWEPNGSVTHISTEGLTELIREQTGVKIGRITDAAEVLEPPGGETGWIFFTTSSGDIYLASGVRTPDAAEYDITWMARLGSEFPYRFAAGTPTGDLVDGEPVTLSGIDREYCMHSLTGPVGRQIRHIKFDKESSSPYVVAAFVAGLTQKELIETADYDEADLPKTPGIAVFEAKGRSARLLAWTLAEDAVFKANGWAFKSVEQLSDGSYRLALPDGRTLTAEVILPEKKTTLFGEEYVGDCEIRFLPVEGIGADALAEAREEAREELLWEQNLEKIRQEGAEEQRLEEEKARREEIDRETRERIDAAYDAFLAEHYELEDLSSYLAAYATRRIDLNADGWNELVVYRMPTQSAYPLDIYEYDRYREEVCAFHTSLEGIPASLNADPGGFYFAQIGEHDADRPDGFYGDFFRVNGETFLIAMDAGEFWQKIVCHAFSSVTDRLAAQTVFTAELYREWYFEEPKQNRAFINGQEIPIDNYGGALLEWRSTWSQRVGGAGEWICQEPLWNESEQSGWPFGWLKERNDELNGKTTKQQWTTPDGRPLFTLTFPAGWGDNVITEAGEWTEDPESEFCLQISFYDRLVREYENLPGLLGSLVLYRHSPDRFYPTGHTELYTLTLPGGESCDLVLVFPGDMQYWDFADHYNLWLTKLKNVAARVSFPTGEGYRTTVSPERAKILLHDALVRAYENIYGPFEPLASDPTPEGAVGVEDRLYLRFVITRLTLADGRTGAYEDEDFYYFPIIFPFAVDKESGAIYKVYEGIGGTDFTPFSPLAPDALTFAG